MGPRREPLTDTKLLEALTWLTTPAPDWARQAGYLKELIAIQARYRRCRAAWEPHLVASRAAIDDAVDRCRDRRHAIVYGSGLLLDVPLARLSHDFARVTLVDAVHLRSTRRAVRQFANVRCVEADLSGVAVGLLLGAAKGADQLPRPAPPMVEQPDDIDLAVSANVLTQLPVTPLQYLDRHLDLPADDLDLYARAIMQAHLDHLDVLDAVCCLLAEMEIAHLAPDGTVLETIDPLRGLALPPAHDSWHWTVAPRGEVSRAYAIRNHVAAAISMPQCSESAAKRRGASP